MDPVRSLIGGLQLADVREQLLPQRRRLVWPQKGSREGRRPRRCAARAGSWLFSGRRAGRSCAAMPILLASSASASRSRLRALDKIRRVEVVFAGNALTRVKRA